MTRPLQALLAAVVAVAGTAAGVLSFQWQSGGIGAADPAQTGRLVLAAQLQGLDGKPQAVGRWRGSILVVNFWATWCGPCREEIPAFIRLQNQSGPKSSRQSSFRSYRFTGYGFYLVLCPEKIA